MKVTTAIKKILRWIANPDIGNQLGKAELKRIKDGRLSTRLYKNNDGYMDINNGFTGV